MKGRVSGVSTGANYYEYIKARSAEAFGYWKGEKGKSFNIKVDYFEKNNTTAYLDYIRVHLKRALQTYNEPTFFRNVSSINHKSCFIIKNATSNTIVLDVTDAQSPKVVEAVLSGTELSFVIPQSYQLREFAVVQFEESP